MSNNITRREYLLELEKVFDIVESFLKKHSFGQVAEKVKFNRYDTGVYRILRQISDEFIDDETELINFYHRISPKEPHYEDLIIYFLTTFVATFFGTYFASISIGKKIDLNKKRKKLILSIKKVMRGFMFRQMLHENKISFEDYVKLVNGEIPKKVNKKFIKEYEIKFLKNHSLKNFDEIIVKIKYELKHE